jgi:hypothetical protein
VYTLGECIPLGTGGEDVVSRVVLYHGSFRALAALDEGEFDWIGEARETLLHELRHHLEWRANTERLEAYDWAAEQNFARANGAAFDPLFYQAGEPVAQGVYQVDDDLFIEHVVRRVPERVTVTWHGRPYSVALPASAAPPLLIELEGLPDPPAGAVFLVVRRKPRLLDLIHRTRPAHVAMAAARPDA